MTRFLLGCVLALVLTDSLDARPRRGQSIPWQPAPTYIAPVVKSTRTAGLQNALAEANTLRAARGLAPFTLCPGLQSAAEECVKYRARYRVTAHTSNDFAFIPDGYSCDATGSNITTYSYQNFATCCLYDTGYRYAGAAIFVAEDGTEYHSLFVRR